MPSAADRPSWLHLAALFGLSAATLAFEILLLRLFEFSHWHYFAGFAIALALLGLGAAGTTLALMGAAPQRWGDGWFLGGLLTAALGLYLVLGLHAYVALRPVFAAWDARELAKLLLVDVAAFLPFYGAGLAIGQVFVRWPRHARKLYAVNLLGLRCRQYRCQRAPHLRIDCRRARSHRVAAPAGGYRRRAGATATTGRGFVPHRLVAGAAIDLAAASARGVRLQGARARAGPAGCPGAGRAARADRTAHIAALGEPALRAGFEPGLAARRSGDGCRHHRQRRRSAAAPCVSARRAACAGLARRRCLCAAPARCGTRARRKRVAITGTRGRGEYHHLGRSRISACSTSHANAAHGRRATR